jgi:hypothetical protein
VRIISTVRIISKDTITDAREFFEARGARGCEGTAMIAANDGGDSRLVIPDQRATPVPCCTVTVTECGKLQLVAALDASERYIARIHSHPGAAFHSETDDQNPALTFDGALSIVAPFFGLGLREGFGRCAVYYRHENKWVELPPVPTRERVVVVR